MFKKGVFKVVAPLAAVSMLLAACGADDSSSSDSSSDGKLTKLVAGTEATYAPFEYLDDKGNVVGIDAEILAAISEETGVDIEMKNVGWDPMLSQVTSGEIDMGAAAITIREDRLETYDFTEPYYEASLLIVTKEDSDIETLEDLKDKKVAVQINTTGHLAAQDLQGKASTDILAYENFSVALTEVLTGAAEAAIGDNAVILEYIKNNPESGLKTIEDDSFKLDYFGIMVKKGNKEVLDVLNEGLAAIKENGKLDEIVEKYTGVTQELE